MSRTELKATLNFILGDPTKEEQILDIIDVYINNDNVVPSINNYYYYDKVAPASFIIKCKNGNHIAKCPTLELAQFITNAANAFIVHPSPEIN
jgi:hypothetical protein